MKIRDLWVMVMAAAFVLSAAALYAGEKDLPEVKTKVSQVAIFKDGYGFFVRTGKVKLEKGWAEFDVVPRAVLGTVWVYTDRNNETVDLLVRGTKEVERTGKVVNLFALLAENIDAEVELMITEKTKVSGTLVYVSNPDSVIVPRRSSSMPNVNPEPFVIVKTEKGSLVTLKYWQIQQVEFHKKPNLETALEAEEKPVLKAKVLTRRDKVNLGLAYLEEGIRWLPSYLVVVKDDETALINLRATVMNDAEDLEGTRLSMVIGVPHFSAKGELDPIGLREELADTAEFRSVGRAMMSQSAPMAGGAYQPVAAERAGPPVPPPPGELAGIGMEELYLYHKDDITLRKGERVQFPLLTGEVPYKTIYQWDANMGTEVWQCLKLTNTLKAPWTTGVAMTVKGAQPLGQDMLKYTPPGATTNLKVTQAPAIRVDLKENEIARGKPERIGGYTWSLVTLEGELKLENYKDKAVQVEVEKTVSGQVEAASDDAEIAVQASPDKGLNPLTSLKWDISIGAGETKILTYQCAMYVRI